MSPVAPIGVSMGDPAGIGPEIILKAWQALRSENHPFLCIGDPAPLNAVAERLGMPAVRPISAAPEAADVFADALPCLPASTGLTVDVRPGQPDTAHAGMVLAAIRDGVAGCIDGTLGALVTAPIAKSVLYDAGFTFPGHTEYLAELTAETPLSGPRGPAMMLSGGGLRVVLTSIHEALTEAVSQLDPDHIKAIARLTHHALIQDFGIASPRLALAGLNPHAGEAGALGREEIEILNPMAAQLRAEGIDITDACPPDTMFHAEARETYDAAICLYHDQGLIPVKTLDFHGGVNITLGLPIVRTSPDHGTAFNIAGTGQARPDSLIAAVRQAQAIAEQRA